MLSSPELGLDEERDDVSADVRHAESRQNLPQIRHRLADNSFRPEFQRKHLITIRKVIVSTLQSTISSSGITVTFSVTSIVCIGVSVPVFLLTRHEDGELDS